MGRVSHHQRNALGRTQKTPSAEIAAWAQADGAPRSEEKITCETSRGFAYARVEDLMQASPTPKD